MSADKKSAALLCFQRIKLHFVYWSNTSFSNYSSKWIYGPNGLVKFLFLILLQIKYYVLTLLIEFFIF